MYLYIYFFFLSYKLSVPTKVGVTQLRYMTHTARCMCVREHRRGLSLFGLLHASCPNRKAFQTRPVLRREDRLYQRDVLSGFARGPRYPSRSRLSKTAADLGKSSRNGSLIIMSRVHLSPPRVSTLEKKTDKFRLVIPSRGFRAPS